MILSERVKPDMQQAGITLIYNECSSRFHPFLFPSLSLSDVLCDPTNIWRQWAPFEAMIVRTAFIRWSPS